MKKVFIYFILTLIFGFLVGCASNEADLNVNNGKNLTSDSPENALRLLESKEHFAKIIHILNSIEISDTQVFYVFEGEVNKQTEWYVANIEKNDDSEWSVIEAINIGTPNNENASSSSGGNTFTAGLSNNSEDIKDNRKVIEIPDNDYFVWVEFH